MNLVFYRNRSRKTPVVFGIMLMTWALSAQAQTFSKQNVKLYDYFNTFFIQEIPVKVNGLPLKADSVYGLEKVKLTLHHERISDLKIQLQAPNGTTVWLTNRNGGLEGKDYIETCFRQYGKDGLVNTGKPPFTGEYIPDGQITYLNNGSDPNGEWKLLVEDLKSGEDGFLDSIEITFSDKPAFMRQKKYCSLENPGQCSCGIKGCELLPDLVVVPYFTQKQYQEFAFDDQVYPGQLKISVAIGNIGMGPLEVSPDTLLTGACCTIDSSKTKTDKRYQLLQKVYSKSGSSFTSRTQKTGTIYFENKPGHQHYHVDDWIEMRLIKIIKGKRKLMCKGSKVSYCLFTTGMFYEGNQSSLINGKVFDSQMLNYGLGNYYACSLDKQGISVGGYDYYGLMYEGQYLQLPKGFKNGNYILEIEIDPEHKYAESNVRNNTFSMPIKIDKQN